MAASSESISAAITQLQEATKALIELKEYIEMHNLNTEAHPDIRELIDRLIDDEPIYSNTQIREIIHELLDAHKEENFKDAHTGWAEYENAVTERFTQIETDITEIRDILRGKEEAKTDLDAKLLAIENRYAPVLARLQTALKEAQLAGDTELADSYRRTIQEELDRKTAEIMHAVEEWQHEHNE
jgi:hypothetical protein